MEDSQGLIRVTAAILVRDGRVLIARRRPGGRQPNRWEFPGGKIEPGETPRNCLRRELAEEFGIETAVGDYVGSHRHRYDHGVVELMAFRVSWSGGTMGLRAHAAIQWAAPEELADFDISPADIPFAEMIRSGEIAL